MNPVPFCRCRTGFGGDFDAATRAPDDPSCGISSSPHTIWFRYTARDISWIDARVDGAYGATGTVSAWTGERGALRAEACEAARIRFQAVAGRTYHLMVTLEDWGPARDQWLILSVVHAGPPVAVSRMAGATRVDTEVAVSRTLHDRAATVVLARSDQYADSLAGAVLAAHVGGPLLLTPPERLASAVAAEIDRLGAAEVVTLGGVEALSPLVHAELHGLAEGRAAGDPLRVRRVQGADRFETAALVAGMLPASDEVFVAEGAHADPGRGWPDALSGSALAARLGRPVLLVERDRLPGATAAALAGAQRVVIVGGEVAVSHPTAAAIDAVTGQVVRLAGRDRHETAVAVADETVRRGFGVNTAWLATSGHWPDALAGAAAAGRGDAVLLLVPRDRLGSAGEWLSGTPLAQVHVLGGTDAVAATVEANLRVTLGGERG
jgi:putative cell wall-binding protein